MENLDTRRITAGLPDKITMPDEVVIAFEEGTISEKDLLPNIVAHVSHKYPSSVEPSLSTSERVARWRHIRALAALSQGWQ